MPALDRNGRMKIIENMNTNKKLLLLCVPLLLSACKESAVVPPMPSGVSVKVMEIEGGRVQYEQNYSGTVEAGFSVPLSFQTAGNLLQVLVSDGQSVREGQVLATLDPVSLQSAYDAAKAVLEQAEDAYLRYESLHEKGSMTDLKWREVLTKRQQALSMESIARRNLEHAVLKAPVDGIVAAKDIEAGMNVVPGMPVMKILCIDHVNVKIPVPENEISRTRIGQEATVKVPALQDRLFHGAVTEKGISANPVSRTYDVKIALDNHGHDLMPGMVCKVDIADSSRYPSGIVVPNNCIQIDYAGHAFVWIAKDGIATQRRVRMGGSTEKGTLVSQGLERGELLIVEGGQKVSEGTEIVIKAYSDSMD